MTDASYGTARELALDVLMEILERGVPCHTALRQALGKYQYMEKQDRAFITRVTEGTLEYLLQIDHILDQFSSTKVEKMKPFIRTLLRMSVYQICHMDRVPDAAVCSEAVKLAEKRHFAGLKGFVNGVLRNISRQKAEIRFPDASVRYSMPRWIIDLWEDAYGAENTEKMLEASLAVSPLSVRCSLDMAVVPEIIGSLRRQGVTVTEHALADDILCLENVDYLGSLDAFQKGLVTAQDMSSACVAKAAGIRAGDQILDVCGAPGGKALHAVSLLRRAEREADASRGAEMVRPVNGGFGDGTVFCGGEVSRGSETDRPANRGFGDGTVFCGGEVSCGLETDRPACGDPDGGVPHGGTADGGGSRTAAPRGRVLVRDISGRRMGMIRENLARCGYEDSAVVQVWDALDFDPAMAEKADIVLADLPCSGLGAIGRKPDIKYRVKPEDIAELAGLQRRILSVVWRYVRPGGVLVYSTCTVTPAENRENMEWFLGQYPFDPVDITGRLGEKIRAESMKDGYLQLLQGVWPCDGFFLAVMRRRAGG